VNVHAERSAGWSVLCFVVLIIVSVLLTGALPDVTVKPTDQAAFVGAHRAALLWGAWLTFPAGAFFLWFLVGLRTYLRQAPGRQEGLPDFAFGAGIVVVAVAFVSAFLQSAIAYAPPDLYVTDGLPALYTALVFTVTGLGWAPISIFLFAAAHSMRRHGSAPAWLAALGYLAGVTSGLATFTVFFTNPALSPTGLDGALLGSIPATIWLIGTGVTLLRIKVDTPQPG
jgi:hypothetical protein